MLLKVKMNTQEMVDFLDSELLHQARLEIQSLIQSFAV